jgi:zinc resistance-associated protein
MTNKLVAGTLALSLAGAGLALAQSNSNSGSDDRAAPRAERGYRPSAEDMAAFADARIAALKAGLRLTPDQEKNWPAVETALRDLAKQRAERRREFADRMRERREAREAGTDQARPDLYERLRRAADRMTARAASVKRLADAVGPLYGSLDDAQKRRLAMLIQMERPRGRFGFNSRRSSFDGDRRGFGRDEGEGRGWRDRGPRRWIDEESRGERWNEGDSRGGRWNDDEDHDENRPLRGDRL